MEVNKMCDDEGIVFLIVLGISAVFLGGIFAGDALSEGAAADGMCQLQGYKNAKGGIDYTYNSNDVVVNMAINCREHEAYTEEKVTINVIK